jgi:transcriptional regulator with XRE-family HTH domain
MFSDKHLGRAVALRREVRGKDQSDLAREIGVHKSTMNGYEKGTRGMDEATIEKISLALDCAPIEIWEDAFNIFRYNYFREQAEKAGVSIEELAAKIQSRPSVEQIQASFQALFDYLWKLLADVLAFLRTDRQLEGRTQIPAWGVFVSSETSAKRKRALELQRGKAKPPKPKKPRRSPVRRDRGA